MVLGRWTFARGEMLAATALAAAGLIGMRQRRHHRQAG